MIRLDVRMSGGSPEAFLEALSEHLTPALARAVLRAAQEAAGELSLAAMEVLTKAPTGSLARSFEPDLQVRGREVSAGAFSRLPYAAIHDAGGVIRARRRKYLAIPLSGVPRGMGPRQYPSPLEFRPSRRGGGVLVDAAGQARYALKPQVRVRATNYVATALSRLEGKLDGITTDELVSVTARAERGARGAP